MYTYRVYQNPAGPFDKVPFRKFLTFQKPPKANDYW
ncbi:MAG: hypothetical protein MRERC_3c022 [Mycoplasmataceae bacterium RC_NB112A]|nr:MAG: hypothetical protein MRERC_3c022 [Mycoplasmataceae bacterium RC_NB112A]